MSIQRKETKQLVDQAILDKMSVDLDTYLTLKNSIFPGAKDESMLLALAYCRTAQLDILQKPVHIVPMMVQIPGTTNKEWRDTVMPGITLYRIQASRSGSYAGKSEPEFGPDVTESIAGLMVTYPLWCRVTVKKLINGTVCEFTAKEFWKENFASKKDGQPNAMWFKRAYGQLAKCAEAQALRMAWPELVGGVPTAEEMEGKSIEGEYDIVPQVFSDDEIVTEHHVQMLQAKIAEANSEESKVCEHIGVISIESMTMAEFAKVMRMLQAKIKKMVNDSLPINQLVTG